MKNINIHCFIRNMLHRYKFKVIIYDSKDCKIYEGFTNNEGILNINLCLEEKYRIVIIPSILLCPSIYRDEIYLTKNSSSDIYYYFARPCYFEGRKIGTPVTFNLYDRNYDMLPIENGVISLWQNTI